MKNNKEINLFLTKYYLLSIFNSMYFIGSFVMIIVDESVKDPFKISVLLVILSAISIIFEIPSGAFADRFGRKNTVILAKLLAISAFIFFLIRRDYSDFIIAYILTGLSITLNSGAYEAFLYDNMKKLGLHKNYAKYESIKSAIGQITFALSCLFASYLVLYGYNTVIIATIIAALISALLIVPTIKDTHLHDKNIAKLNHNYWAVLKKGFTYSFKHTTILKFIIFIVFVDSFYYILDNYDELILFHLTNNLSMVPILITIEFVLIAFVQVMITKHLQNKKAIFITAIAIFSITFALIGFSFYSFPTTFILLLLFWSGFSIFGFIMNAKKQLLIPSKIRATVNSVEGFLYGIVSLVYLLCFGKIVGMTSYKTGFVVISGFTLLIIIAFLFIIGFDKHLRRIEARR